MNFERQERRIGSVVRLLDIDRLDIVISAEASKAEKELNKLMGCLNKLSGVLGGLNTSGLQGLANSVQKLSIAMAGMNSVKTTDFTRLAKNIAKLAALDTKSLNSAASAMSIISKALNGLGTVSSNAVQIGEMAKNLSKLGSKGIQNAIANMPQLASALNNMMRTLQSAPRVSNNLIRMTEAIGRLNLSGNQVSSATRSLNSGFRGYGNYADKAVKKTKSLTSAMASLYARVWLLRRAFKVLFSAVEKSMDFSETVNYFEVAMRKIGDDAAKNWKEQGYESAEAYAESFSRRSKELTAKMTGFSIDSDGNAELTNQKNLGLDPDKVLQYQAQYAQMADSIGMTEEAALNTSKALTMLGTDWASLRNIEFDQAWEKFASALAGQSRAVRALGIDITQATLQEYAYKYGLTGAISEMNQATKAQLRLLAILDQSKVAFGDLANTIQSPANQLRVLKQNFSSLARIIGNIFLPVVAKVLPYINGVVIALQRLFQWVGSLLGIKLTNINTSVGGMSDSVSDLVDSTEDEDNALSNANKTAEKLKNTILGFDELNVLNDPDAGNSTSGSDAPAIGGSPILDAAIADALADYEKAWNDAFGRMENKAADFADRLTASFKKLWKVAEPTRKAIKKLWNEGLSKLGKFTWTALKDFYGEFLVPVGRWALGTGIPALVNALNDALNKINWDRLNASLKGFWQALAPFATSLGDGLVKFYKDLFSVGADFINAVVPGGLDALADALKKINPETAERIGYSLGILFTAITAFKGLTWIGNILGASGPLAKGLGLLAAHPYAAIAVGIGGVVVALDKFGIIDVDWDWLWSKVTQIKDILSEFISNVDVSGLSDAIGNLWKAFQPFAKGFADALLDAFDFLLNGIGAPLLNMLVDIFNGLAEALAKMDPDTLEAIGKALGEIAVSIAAIKISKNLITRLKKLKSLLCGTAAGQSLSSLLGRASAEARGGFSSILLSIGKLGGIFGTATVAAWGGTEAIKAFNRESVDTAEAAQILSDSLMEMKNSGDLSYESWDKLYAVIIDGQAAGKTASEIYEDVAATMEKMGVKTSIVQEAAENAGISFEELNETALDVSAGVNGNMDTIAQSTIDAAASVGLANGLWAKGLNGWEQISGEKATDIYNGILDGLYPQNGQGYYDIGNGTLVSFGAGIESEIGSVQKTISGFTDNTLAAGLEVGYQIGYDGGKNVVQGFASGFNKNNSAAMTCIADIGKNVLEQMNKTSKDVSDSASEMKKSLDETVDDAHRSAKNIAGAFSGIHIPVPHFSVSTTQATVGSFSFPMPKLKVDWYATGGFPNAGELFMANEKGPEMVGKMGHRNVVANNKQITDGIKAAVVDGMMEVAMATNSGNMDNAPYVINAVLKTEDNETLARAVEKGNLKRDVRFRPVSVY